MNVTWLNKGVAVSPQVYPTDLDDLKAAGFRTIINNRPDFEAPDQPTSDSLEREAIRLGLGYAFIPVTAGDVTEHDVAEFAHVIAEADLPVLAFCRSGNRSAQLWTQMRKATPNSFHG